MDTNDLGSLDPQKRAVISRYLKSCPIKVGQLAREFDVAVRVSRLERGISGQITREGNHYVIRINRYEVRERQRFTIAHELAHFLLHRKIIDASPSGIRDNVLYRSGEPRVMEFEANKLAAEIVMPRKLISEKLKEFGGYVTDEVIEELAAEFQVSSTAMESRLDQVANA